MPAPVTDSITRVVRPGHEAEFEAALREFISRSLQTPGQLGVSVLRPAPESGSHHYHILRRFESASAREAFYNSALFSQWLEMVGPLIEGPVTGSESGQESVTGLEGWFTLPGQKTFSAPPKWKIAIASVIGVHPTSQFWPLILVPLLRDWPTVLRDLTITIAIVTTLTWVVMPFVTWLLRDWLNARPA